MPRTVFVRGFETPSLKDDAVGAATRVAGDSEVDSLYDQFVNKKGDYTSWEFKHRVFLSAKRLIGTSLRGWVRRHSNSTFIGQQGARFIEDTLKFITSGYRTVSAVNWLELVPVDVKEGMGDKPTMVNYDEVVVWGKGAADETDINYLAKWCAHPRGFDDLLTSLYLMYGSANSKIKQKPVVIHPKNPKLHRLFQQ